MNAHRRTSPRPRPEPSVLAQELAAQWPGNAAGVLRALDRLTPLEAAAVAVMVWIELPPQHGDNFSEELEAAARRRRLPSE